MDESVRHLVNASIPAYACPEGTKMYILNLGTLNVDEGWYVLALKFQTSRCDVLIDNLIMEASIRYQ